MAAPAEVDTCLETFELYQADSVSSRKSEPQCALCCGALLFVIFVSLFLPVG
jgi:hypothetical protein